jgi:hypothetical protein
MSSVKKRTRYVPRSYDPEEVRHGTCMKCGKESRRLVLCCTFRAESTPTTWGWVCWECEARLDEKEAYRELALSRRIRIAGVAERRIAQFRRVRFLNG